MFNESKEEFFFRNSQSRFLRRRMAKKLGLMKHGWQTIKEEFPPYNKPMNLGINEFKRKNPGIGNKAVVRYKLKARAAFMEALNNTKA